VGMVPTKPFASQRSPDHSLAQPQWNTLHLGMLDVYLRSIEPLIAIVLDTGMR
jgi:hypothetical protein